MLALCSWSLPTPRTYDVLCLSAEMADSRHAAVVGRVVGILEREMHDHVAVFPVSEDLVCFQRVPFTSSVCPSSPLVGIVCPSSPLVGRVCVFPPHSLVLCVLPPYLLVECVSFFPTHW